MSSSAFNSDEASGRPFADSETPAASKRDEDSDLLDQVLRETLELTNSDTALKKGELAALVDVARRHASPDLSLDAVVDLVEAILRTRFECFSNTADLLDKTARAIAGTVHDDPRAWQRIEKLWSRLCEAAR